MHTHRPQQLIKVAKRAHRFGQNVCIYSYLLLTFVSDSIHCALI